jgi:hypothetical protein
MTEYRSIDNNEKRCGHCIHFKRYAGNIHGDCDCPNSDHYKHVLMMGHLTCAHFEED